MEYFIVAVSNPAPFFGDTDTTFVEADTPERAADKFAESYTHPCGLFSASVWRDANEYHKGYAPLYKVE